jgi:hypothetical protein
MKQEIATRITEYLAQYPIPHIWESTKITPYTVFKNYQPKKQKGLRLTAFGWELMRPHFRYWSYQCPVGWSPKPGHLIGLEKHLDWPYYHGAGYFRIFGENDAMEIRLVNDDIILWLDGLSRRAQGKG